MFEKSLSVEKDWLLCWREGRRLQPFEKIQHCQWIISFIKTDIIHMLLPRPLDGRLNLPGMGRIKCIENTNGNQATIATFPSKFVNLT